MKFGNNGSTHVPDLCIFIIIVEEFSTGADSINLVTGDKESAENWTTLLCLQSESS